MKQNQKYYIFAHLRKCNDYDVGASCCIHPVYMGDIPFSVIQWNIYL